MAKARQGKASLRGWWRALPFLLSGFALMFTFAMLEARLLNNEYRSNSITSEIWDVRANTKKLRDQRHHLNRMERMESQAPSLSLIPANPEQIVPLEAAEGDYKNAQRVRPRTQRTSRSVVMHLAAPQTQELHAPSSEQAIASADNRATPTG